MLTETHRSLVVNLAHVLDAIDKFHEECPDDYTLLRHLRCDEIAKLKEAALAAHDKLVGRVVTEAFYRAEHQLHRHVDKRVNREDIKEIEG